jgi:acyl-coenzyme A synthetase/AMP-(fatty) acid ligase
MANFLPPLDCSLNLREIIDSHIDHRNRSAAYSFADEDGHITEISHFEFARAAHRVAHLLRPQRRGTEGEVVAIVALTDVLIYQTIVAGCITAGLIVRLPLLTLTKSFNHFFISRSKFLIGILQPQYSIYLAPQNPTVY